jgi:phosphoribosylformylglycinamidine synthase
MMPHPERACSAKLGNEDGKKVFNSLLLASISSNILA